MGQNGSETKVLYNVVFNWSAAVMVCTVFWKDTFCLKQKTLVTNSWRWNQMFFYMILVTFTTSSYKYIHEYLNSEMSDQEVLAAYVKILFNQCNQAQLVYADDQREQWKNPNLLRSTVYWTCTSMYLLLVRSCELRSRVYDLRSFPCHYN